MFSKHRTNKCFYRRCLYLSESLVKFHRALSDTVLNFWFNFEDDSNGKVIGNTSYALIIIINVIIKIIIALLIHLKSM